jgi:hypothetical protein
MTHSSLHPHRSHRRFVEGSTVRPSVCHTTVILLVSPFRVEPLPTAYFTGGVMTLADRGKTTDKKSNGRHSRKTNNRHEIPRNNKPFLASPTIYYLTKTQRSISRTDQIIWGQ